MYAPCCESSRNHNMCVVVEMNVAVVSIEADSTAKRSGFVFCINTS